MPHVSQSLQSRIDALGSPVTQAWARFDTMVRDWNQKTNLIGKVDAAGRAEVLFLDAVTLLDGKFFEGAERVVEIGSGVGAPMIPLAIALPNLRVTMVEPRRRRVVFMRFAVGALGLSSRVTVDEAAISETQPAEQYSGFDVAISRATFPPAQWLTIAEQIASRVIVLTTQSTQLDRAPALDLAYQGATSEQPRRALMFTR